MVHKYYNLVFYGDIASGCSVQDVRQNLIALAYLDPEAQEDVLAGKPIIIREHLDYTAATIMQSTCEAQGARCQIELAKIETAAGVIVPAYLCQIEFRGEVAAGRRLADVKIALQERFRLAPQALELLFSGQPRMIKADIDYQTALQYLTALEDAGAVCHIKPSRTPLPPERILAENIFQPANLALLICPNCGKRQPIAPTCTQCGSALPRFVKRRRARKSLVGGRQLANARLAGQATDKSPPLDDDRADTVQETPALPEPGRKPEPPRWIYWILGNAILAFGLSLCGFSIEGFLVPFSLVPGANDVTKYDGLFALLYSNLQMVGLTGILVPVVMFFRNLFDAHENSAMRHVYLLILAAPVGVALMIDHFVPLFGSRFVTMFVLKGVGLSMLGYGIGLGCFLLVHRGETLPPADEQELPVKEEEDEIQPVDESEAEPDKPQDIE